MPHNLYQELLRYLHFVNNDSINARDKLAKICPLISMVRDEFVKIEPEEYKWVDEQIMPVKARYSSIRQYNPKKPKRCWFKNLVHADIAGFMCDFSVYDGKNSAELDDGKFGHLQKCAQVVTKLCSDLPGHKNLKSSLTTGSQSLVQFDWTVCEVVLLIQPKFPWKMVLWIELWWQFWNNGCEVGW